jgi:hypothetical protein
MDAIRNNIAWRVIPIAGTGAGLVFLVVNVLLTPLVLDVSAGLTLRYFAALVLGPDILTNTSPAVLIVGILVHYLFSMFFTFVIALVVHRWGLLVGIIGGSVLGLAIYGINLYAMTLLFPFFFAIHSSVLLLSHVLFGAVAGGIYEQLDHFDQPLIKEQTYDRYATGK